MERDDHTRAAIEDRVQEQRRASGTRRYTLTLEVSPDTVQGYVATLPSYEPGDPCGRGRTVADAIGDWLDQAQHDPIEALFQEADHG